MTGAENRRERLLRLVRPHHGEPEDQPRVEALDAFLREVDDLRLTLETDLSLAASAVEAGSAQVAADILSHDSEAVRGFEKRALGHLAELDGPGHRRPRLPAHAGPILVAAALVGLLAGVAPQALAPRTEGTPQTVAATDSLQRLQELAASGDTERVREASLQLHRQLAGVLATAKSDPAAAQAALLLLTYEQSAIVRSGDSRELADVLRQSQALARAIVAALPPSVRTARPHPPVVVATESTSSPKPKPKQAPAKSTSSPRPQPTATPRPSASASPEPTNDPYPLPSAPLAP